jgi:hypothetical protein
MKLFKKYLIVNLFLLTNISTSEGSINLLTGTYEISHLDFILVNSQTDVRIQRSYSSRRVLKGWWGWGWCTDLESRIVKKDKNLIYSDCMGEHEFKSLNNIWISSTLPGYEISYDSLIYKIKIFDGTETYYDKDGDIIYWTDRSKRKVTIKKEVSWLGMDKIVLATQDNFEIHLEFNSESLVSRVTIKSLKYLSLFREIQFLRPKIVEFNYS